MATYDDFDGVWFTIQAMRLSQPEVLEELSFLIVDNNPGGAVGEALRGLEGRIPGVRYLPFDGFHGTAVRDLVFRESTADIVCCVDSHVLLQPGALGTVRDWFVDHPDSLDLLQGPLLYDDLAVAGATHLAARWGAGMYGQWEQDPRGLDPKGEPFEIDMQGLGVFMCRRVAWPGLNPRFRGFGGEEGYLHEKVRRQGGRVLCHPAMRWAHRFTRPAGAPYPNLMLERVRNFRIGWGEIGWDVTPVEEHFTELLGDEPAVTAMLAQAAIEAEHPAAVFDGVFCLGPHPDGCVKAALPGHPGLSWRVECVPGPSVQESVLALSDRRAGWRFVLSTARRRGYNSVLVLDSSGPRSPTREGDVLPQTQDTSWDVCFFVADAAGPDRPTATGVHARAFDRVTAAVADDASTFLADHGDLDGFFYDSAGRGLTSLGQPPEPMPDRPRPCGGLRVDRLGDGLLITGPEAEQLHRLNSTAAFVFELCDGLTSLASVVLQMQEAFGLPSAPLTDVEACLAQLRRGGVLTERIQPWPQRPVRPTITSTSHQGDT